MQAQKSLPQLKVEFRGEEFILTRRADLGVWTIDVRGAHYVLGEDPDGVGRFLLHGLRPASDSLAPAMIASRHYPLLLSIDTTHVRAWPGFLPRGRGAPTYINPATGDRVATLYDHPVWMFSAAGRDASACGTATPEQTVDDVADLARVWLRSA